MALSEKRKAQMRAYTKANPERNRASSKKFSRLNPEKMTAKEAKHRAIKLGQTPEMNAAEWAEINAMYLYNKIMPGDWHVDHVDPLDNGGLHHPNNLQILSRYDNCSKGNTV